MNWTFNFILTRVWKTVNAFLSTWLFISVTIVEFQEDDTHIMDRYVHIPIQNIYIWLCQIGCFNDAFFLAEIIEIEILFITLSGENHRRTNRSFDFASHFNTLSLSSTVGRMIRNIPYFFKPSMHALRPIWYKYTLLLVHIYLPWTILIPTSISTAQLFHRPPPERVYNSVFSDGWYEKSYTTSNPNIDVLHVWYLNMSAIISVLREQSPKQHKSIISPSTWAQYFTGRRVDRGLQINYSFNGIPLNNRSAI